MQMLNLMSSLHNWVMVFLVMLGFGYKWAQSNCIMEQEKPIVHQDFR